MLVKTDSNIQFFKSNDWEENWLDITIDASDICRDVYSTVNLQLSFWYFYFLFYFQHYHNILFPGYF